MKMRAIPILLAAAIAVLPAACAGTYLPATEYGQGYQAGVEAYHWGGLTRTWHENNDRPEWRRGFDAGWWNQQYRLHGEGGGDGGGGN